MIRCLHALATMVIVLPVAAEQSFCIMNSKQGFIAWPKLSIPQIGLLQPGKCQLRKEGALFPVNRYSRILCTTMKSNVPSYCYDWEEIKAGLPIESPANTSEVTFYRNRNGWCLYSQRVWMALEHKGIPFDVCTISSKDMPQWYKDMVPTKQVPAIELHDSGWNPSVPGSGRVLWGSMDIIRSLDDLFLTVARLSPKRMIWNRGCWRSRMPSMASRCATSSTSGSH